MQGVVVAISKAQWGEALSRALEIWRTTRAPQLARLIDALGDRASAPLDGEGEPWRAPYDAARVSSLLAQVTVRMRRSEAYWPALRDRWGTGELVGELVRALDRERATPLHLNWLERLFVMLDWPEDPRGAAVLADWLTSHELFVRSPAFDIVYGAIADRLVVLSDTRVIPQLDAFLGDPAAGFRNQRSLVERVRAALAARVPSADEPVVATLIEQLAERDEQVAALWRAVADNPADVGARAVLGDALVAAGHARGELVVLQLAIEREPANPVRDPRTKRLVRLLDAWWNQWLGSALAAVLVRKGTEFRGGMLEVIRVGQPSTPRRAWAGARGHRELATVHTVLVGCVPAVEYAQFVAALPQLSTLEVDAPETLRELARIGAPLSLEELRYTRARNLDGVMRPSREAFQALATVAPRLARIVLDSTPLRTELSELVAALRIMFPCLTSVVLTAPSREAAREFEAQFVDAPLVEIQLVR